MGKNFQDLLKIALKKKLFPSFKKDSRMTFTDETLPPTNEFPDRSATTSGVFFHKTGASHCEGKPTFPSLQINAT